MNLQLAILVGGGIVLAGLLSWFSVAYFPENRTILRLEPYAQINYEALPDDAELANLERGRSYYVQLCAQCHGENGSGNGEFRYRMVPKPTNLMSAKVVNKSDEELSALIRDGIEGSAMVPWGNSLSPIQRQQIVGYLRYLNLQGVYLANG